MTNLKTTKKALFSSAIALLLCFTMLLGTTFAWFTDSVTSGGNVITTGTLKVAMYYADGDEDPASVTWADASHGAIFNNTKWEPGYVEAKHLKIANEGTLAFRYKLLIVPDGEVEALADVIDVYYVEGATKLTRETLENATPVATLRELIEDTDGAAHGALLPVGETAADDYERVGEVTATIAFKMRAEAGNEYQNMSIGSSFSIHLLATQYTEELDSFDDQYDKDADYEGEISNETSLAAAFANGGTYKLVKNIALTNPVTVAEGKEVTLTLNGNSITAASGNAIVNNGTLTIDGVAVAATYGLRAGALNTVSSETAYAIMNTGKLTVNNANISGIYNSGALTVNGGSVYTTRGGGSHAIYHVGTSLLINGGSFSGNGNEVINANVGTGAPATINGGTFDKVEKSSYLITGPNIVINGGTFNAYDENGEKPATHKVNRAIINGGTFNYAVKPADGFQAVENGDGTYTVLPALENGSTLSVVAGYPSLYTDGTDFYVYDAAGLLSLNTYFANNKMNNSVWACSYNIMADIDAAGCTWNNVYMITGTSDREGINLLGNGHTISNLTIAGGGMLGGTPNCTNSTNPAFVKNLTFDNVTVTGNAHFAGVIWGGAATCGDVYLEDVHIKNSSITGKCNVGAFIGGTGEQSANYDLTVTFKDCSVENTTLTANGTHSGVEGDWNSDPTGASVFMGRVFANTSIIFEGTNTETGNTVNNGEGLVGGIYGYTAISNGWWAGTGASNSFTNWYGLVVSADEATVSDALANGETVNLSGDMEVNDQIVMNGGTLNGNGAAIDASSSYNDSDCAISTTSGTVENLTITGDAGDTRAIGSGSSGDTQLTGDLYINNVVVDEVLYAINGSGTGSEKVIVTNSKIYGWISFSNIESFEFENCTIGKGNSSDGYMVIYGNTSFTNCSFEGVFDMGAREENGEVCAAGATITFTNCYYDGVKITAENFVEYFYYGEGDEVDFGNLMRECTIIVDGVTVDNSAY